MLLILAARRPHAASCCWQVRGAYCAVVQRLLIKYECSLTNYLPQEEVTRCCRLWREIPVNNAQIRKSKYSFIPVIEFTNCLLLQCYGAADSCDRCRRLHLSCDSRVAVNGNNPWGSQGVLKCKPCRDRRKKVSSPKMLCSSLQCEYTSIDQPCRFCAEHNLPDCVKEPSPNTRTQTPSFGSVLNASFGLDYPSAEYKNPWGSLGTLKCKQCRDRRKKVPSPKILCSSQQCEYTSIDQPCQFCAEHNLTDCVKEVAPSSHTQTPSSVSGSGSGSYPSWNLASGSNPWGSPSSLKCKQCRDRRKKVFKSTYKADCTKYSANIISLVQMSRAPSATNMDLWTV